jgi:hypothetical protein
VRPARIESRKQIHLSHDAFIEHPELARNFPQVVALLPALQAMRGASSPLLNFIGRFLTGRHATKFLLEVAQ